jgi:hypothetical protein
MTIKTSKSNTLKGGVMGVHCKSCTCSYSSTIPNAMRRALTIPAEVPTKRERKVHCPSGETKTTCDVSAFNTRAKTRITTCKPCSVKRFAYTGNGCDTVFYNSLDLPSAERVVVRSVPYRI